MASVFPDNSIIYKDHNKTKKILQEIDRALCKSDVKTHANDIKDLFKKLGIENDSLDLRKEVDYDLDELEGAALSLYHHACSLIGLEAQADNSINCVE